MTTEMPPALKALLKKITGIDADDPDLDVQVHVVGPNGEGVEDLEKLLSSGTKSEERNPMVLNAEQLAYFREALNGLKSATMRAEASSTPELYRQRIIEMIAMLDYQLATDKDVGAHLAAINAVMGLSLAVLRNLRGMNVADFEKRTTPLMASVVHRSGLVKLPPYTGSRPAFWPDPETETKTEAKENT